MTPLITAARAALEALTSPEAHKQPHIMGAVAQTLLRTAIAKAEAQPVGEPVAWHVCSVNSDGSLSLEFAAPWEERAHEHINDAINEHDIDGAALWVVRPVYASPQPITTEPSPAAQPQVPEWLSRFHHLMKKHGLHPGRTDDDLLDILDAHLSAPPQVPQPLSDEQINKHALLAKDCPPNSAVMLVSSIRRLQSHGIGAKP